MQSKNSIFSNILFYVGIAAGLSLALVSVWADYEAMAYFFTGARFDSYRGMRCPILGTRSETLTVSASMDNPSDRAARPFYRVAVSGLLGRSFENQISLAPGQAQRVEWMVNADDIDLRYFVMTKIMILPYAGLPTREGTCGIFFVNIDGLTGQQVLFTWLAFSLLGITAGLAIAERQAEGTKEDLRQLQRVRRALALIVILAVLSGLAGWVLAGVIFCVLAIFLFVITLFVSINI